MKKTNVTVLIIFLIISVFSANAQLKVASILGNNMVLQRNSEVKIWGKAEPKMSLKITASWSKTAITAVTNEKGDWMAKVKTSEAGGPYTISIEAKKEKIQLDNILLGEVWLCSGQSNMEMPILGFPYQPINGSAEALLQADNQNLRLFTVKKAPMPTPQDSCSGNWEVANAESVGKFSAVGYYYARLLQQKLKIPVGIICSSVGGTPIEAWMDSKTLANFPEPLKQTSQAEKEQNRASYLYNGMINPIVNYTIKGAIWYQGESNRKNYQYYAGLLKAMVGSWRTDFGVGDFPFYYVQIAPYAAGDIKDPLSAFMRDEQLKAMLMIPNSGMVCTLDLGNEIWIHPAEKETIAKRLAGWSLSETYGFKGLQYKSPTFKNFEVKDSVVTISFDDAKLGVTSFDKNVDCFEVAGEDKIFYTAKMIKMSNDFRKIQVVSDKVKVPVAIRYAFSNFPVTEGYLYSTSGLPVPSFRTDNW
jgi:sialate O-acetylesterase